jgi:hypothetical protein
VRAFILVAAAGPGQDASYGMGRRVDLVARLLERDRSAGIHDVDQESTPDVEERQ